MPVVFIFALSLHRCGSGRGEKGRRWSILVGGGKRVAITEPSGVGCGPGCRLAGFGVSRSALFEQEFSRKLDGTWARVQFIYFFFFFCINCLNMLTIMMHIFFFFRKLPKKQKILLLPKHPQTIPDIARMPLESASLFKRRRHISESLTSPKRSNYLHKI